MKIEITGFNSFGAIETEEHDSEKESPIITGLMPLSIVIKDIDIEIPIRFDYEDAPGEPTS